MLANTLTATTFKFRLGNTSGTSLTFNGEAGSQDFGGVANSFMRVREIAA